MPRTSHILLLGLLGIILLGILFLGRHAPTPKPTSKGIADLALTTVDTGKTFTLRQLSKKTILLHFFNSGCLPCLYEFPRLVALAQHRSNDLVVVAISNDVSAHKAYEYARGFCIRHTLGDTSSQALFEQPGNIYVVWDKDQKMTQTFRMSNDLPETVELAPDLTALRVIRPELETPLSESPPPQ